MSVVIRFNRFAMLAALVAVAGATVVMTVPRMARGIEPGSDAFIEWVAEHGQREQFALDTLIQGYVDDDPWTLATSPALIAVDSEGPEGSRLFYSSSRRQRHGVAAPGEGADFQDSISPGEKMIFTAGSDLDGRVFTGAALKIDNAGDEPVVVKATATLGTGNVALFMYEGDCGIPPATTSETITIEPSNDLKLFCFEGMGPFDEIVFEASSGRFGFKGGQPHSKFYLTEGPVANVTVPCEGEVSVEGDEVDSVLSAECVDGKTSVAILIDSFVDATSRYLLVVFPEGGEGTAILTGVNTWNPEPAATANAATKYDPDPFDGVATIADVRFCGEIAGGEPTAAEPVCTVSVLIEDQGDGTVVRTETNLFFGDPQLIRPR
jgi:hypothetical protein